MCEVKSYNSLTVAFNSMFCEQWLFVLSATTAKSNCEKSLPTDTTREQKLLFLLKMNTRKHK